ncbi:hypothetical protein EJ110_NYTH04148 [Nymphaea thermarum]|nr:hypothetical protein EJ110_NYTH04148 [Nymphaea thermarum]
MGTTPAITILMALLLPSVLLQSVTGAEETFNVLSYGAKADAETDNNPAFLKAWSAVCAAATSSATTMYVPSGQYLLHPTLFSGPCVNGNIIVQIDGCLGYWLKFDRENGLRIQGVYLDGKGSVLWACKAGTIVHTTLTALRRWCSFLTLFTNLSRNSERFECLAKITCKRKDITYNIKGTSATQAAITFNCSSSTPCQGIKLTYMSKPSKSYCEYAYGSASTGMVPPINCLQ